MWRPSRARSIALISACTLALGLAACASALPDTPAERALVNDVRTIVRSQVRSEWTVDRIALDTIAPAVAWSACQVTPAARANSLAWLDEAVARERARLGGDSSAAIYHAHGDDLGVVEELVELERIRMALDVIDKRASDDCPFWLAADPDFAGMQGDADRFVLLLESRGGAALNLRPGGLAFSGGGAGRILAGAGIDHGLTLVGGVEIGGVGRFDDKGEVSGVLGGAIPIVLRFVDAGSVIDAELALTTFLEGARGWPPGVRASFAFGVVTPRVAGAFSPSAVFYVSYEFHPERGTEDAFHIIGLGTRIGLDVDP